MLRLLSGAAGSLKADVYRPVANGKPLSGRPAVVMAFGGAFHRGSKGTAGFEEDDASDSAMGDYCTAFAAAGYVCLSIEYRLVPEDPALPAHLVPAALLSKAMLKDPVMTARIDVVRARMGLPLLDDRSRERLWNTVFAASEDVASAVEFVRASAGQMLGTLLEVAVSRRGSRFSRLGLKQARALVVALDGRDWSG